MYCGPAMLQAAPKANGEILRSAELKPRGEDAPTLTELGISYEESAVAQKLAAPPKFASVPRAEWASWLPRRRQHTFGIDGFFDG